jgi:hypothetical protein
MAMKPLGAFGAAVVVLALAAVAACALESPSERWERAAIIVDARALEGPTATGVQRFRVIRYLKGGGPAVIRVATGVTRNPDGSGAASGEGLFVTRGQRWRIFASASSRGVIRTSVCDGSWRHGGRQ